MIHSPQYNNAFPLSRGLASIRSGELVTGVSDDKFAALHLLRQSRSRCELTRVRVENESLVSIWIN